MDYYVNLMPSALNQSILFSFRLFETPIRNLWRQFLQAYRDGQIEQAELLLFNLTRKRPKSKLYALYAERLHLLRRDPQSKDWQGIAVMGPSKYSPLV